MTTDAPWTAATLKAALDGTDAFEEGEVSFDLLGEADPVLAVTMHELGELKLFVAIHGEQVITSALLWPRAHLKDPEAFERTMLRSHKVHLPLAALGITTINGEDWHEVFGAMSARSVLASVVTELRAIAMACVDVTESLPETELNAA